MSDVLSSLLLEFVDEVGYESVGKEAILLEYSKEYGSYELPIGLVIALEKIIEDKVETAIKERHSDLLYEIVKYRNGCDTREAGIRELNRIIRDMGVNKK